MPNHEGQSTPEQNPIVSLIASALWKFGKNDLEATINKLEHAIRLIRARIRQRK
jgi:hypothetical protein